MDATMGSALYRVREKHPELDGKWACPYSIPGRPGHVTLSDWLKAGAPDAVKEYCREALRWTKQHSGHALPGFRRLLTEIQG